MSRIHPLELDQMAPALRKKIEAHEILTPVLPRIAAYLPEVSELQGRLGAAIDQEGGLPARLRELVRLRIAFRNQCRTCMSVRYAPALEDGLTEQLVCSLERPEEAPDLTDAERAAVLFADLFATDHLAIDDATVEGLRLHFSEKEIVALCYWCAYAVGFGRMAAVWNVSEGLSPAIAEQAGEVGPWVDGAQDGLTVLGN